MTTFEIDALLQGDIKKKQFDAINKYKAFQCVNVCWDEEEQMVHAEFCYGNFSAGFELKRVVEKSSDKLPAG